MAYIASGGTADLGRGITWPAGIDFTRGAPAIGQMIVIGAAAIPIGGTIAMMIGRWRSTGDVEVANGIHSGTANVDVVMKRRTAMIAGRIAIKEMKDEVTTRSRTTTK